MHLSARHLFATIYTTVCLACAPEITGPTPAELDELCGEAEPFQLLAFNPSRPISVMWGDKYDDRFAFHVAFEDDESEVWSTGPCGEDPIHLTAGLEVEQWSGFDEESLTAPAICQAETHDILILDPTGAVAPYPLFETSNCQLQRTPHGVITLLGSNLDELVLQPWPSEPSTMERAEQIVLVNGVKPSATSKKFWSHTDTEAFAVTADGNLVVVGLEDLSVEVLASNVLEFYRGADGRRIVWQSVEVTNDHPDVFEGPVFVLDRATGESTFLADFDLTHTSGSVLTLESLGWLYYRDFVDGKFVDTYVRTPEPASFELPRMRPVTVIDDTRALLEDSPPYTLAVVDTTTGEYTVLAGDFASPPINSFGADEDGIHLGNWNGDWWHVDYSGNWQQTLKHALGRGFPVADGRVLTPTQVHAGLGLLVVQTPYTFDETWVDTDVMEYSAAPLSDDGRVFSYGVGDAERYGIWLARLAE